MLKIPSLSAVLDLGENRSELEGGSRDAELRTWGGALNQSSNISKLRFPCPCNEATEIGAMSLSF